MSLQPIILDTDKTAPIYELPLKIRQGDTGDELQVTLGKSFEKYTDLSKVDVELIAKTPDQRLIKQAVTDKSGNTFKVKFPDEMYTNVGVFRNMYFKVGDDSTSSIKLVVLQGIGLIKEAGSYIDDFETLTEEAESYVLALKDFADTGNAKIDDKIAELTGKMTDFVDKARKDLDAAKTAWATFKSNSETAFKDAQDKRTSDFNSQKAGFETDFGDQQTDFENRFKALLTNLQGDYDDFKNLINKNVTDFNTSLDSLDSQATDVKNKYDALKDQLDLAAQNISGVRTNLLTGTSYDLQTYALKNWGSGNLASNSPNLVLAQTYTARMWIQDYDIDTQLVVRFFANSTQVKLFRGNIISAGSSGYSSVTFTTDSTTTNTDEPICTLAPMTSQSTTHTGQYKEIKLEKGSNATDWCPNPAEIATNDGVQTAITNALDEADYPTSSEVDSKISTGVGQAKTYAEQTINNIIGAAPETLDTIAELADAVTKNKDGVQAINEGITKKADKTDVAALQNTVRAMITSISQADYDALVSAGTVDPKILYVIPDA